MCDSCLLCDCVIEIEMCDSCLLVCLPLLNVETWWLVSETDSKIALPLHFKTQIPCILWFNQRFPLRQKNSEFSDHIRSYEVISRLQIQSFSVWLNQLLRPHPFCHPMMKWASVCRLKEQQSQISPTFFPWLSESKALITLRGTAMQFDFWQIPIKWPSMLSALCVALPWSPLSPQGVERWGEAKQRPSRALVNLDPIQKPETQVKTGTWYFYFPSGEVFICLCFVLKVSLLFFCCHLKWAVRRMLFQGKPQLRITSYGR